MNPFKGRHFQRDIILWAVRWYCKYGISYRELQEMLAERGVNVGVSLDIENYCTLRLFFDLSTLAGLNRRNLPEAGILLLFQI